MFVSSKCTALYTITIRISLLDSGERERDDTHFLQTRKDCYGHDRGKWEYTWNEGTDKTKIKHMRRNTRNFEEHL